MHEININSNISRSVSNEELLFEINFSKLKNLGNEYFPSYKDKRSSFENFIKKIGEHFSYNIPTEFDEFFLSLEEVKYFWLSSHPLVVSLENFFHPFDKRNLKSYSEKEEFRRHYIKWANETSLKEKSFFASTIKNIIERNNTSDDILKNLLYATICSFDEKFHSDEKFLNQYDLVNNTILNSALGEGIKTEYLYYENLFKAVHFITKKSFQEAMQFLSNATGLKQSGINANFYLAMLLGADSEPDLNIDLIKSIIIFDIERMNFAISQNNKQLFDYFLKNSVAYNIFKEKRFGDLVLRIKSLYESLGSNNRSSYKFIEISIDKLRGFDIKNYLNDEIIDELNFIDNFVRESSKERIVYLRIVGVHVFEKYQKLIEKIKLRIREIEEKKIADEIIGLHKKIQTHQDEINYVQNDAEKWKERTRNQLNEFIKANENKYTSIINQVEDVLSKIDKNQEFDPYVSFNNSLIYNFIISMIVFIIGGFIDGISDGHDLKTSGLIISVFTGGLKWSAIIFIVGLVIAVIGMISKIIERSNEKQRLIRKISQLKSEKERETETLKKDNEQKIKDYENNSKIKVEKIKALIEVLQKEKVSREAILKEETEKRITKIYETIESVLI